MKSATSEAARRLGVHPVTLALAVRQMVGSIEDCWPEIDDGFVDTLRAAGFGHGGQPADAGASPVPGRPPQSGAARALSVSETAARVLDKMDRQDKWGKSTISWETLRNHYCRTISGCEEAVDELVEKGLMLSDGGRKGVYSLNPARKGEIARNIGVVRKPGAQA